MRVGRIGLDLPPESRNVDVHVVQLGLVCETPDLPEDHSVGEEPPLVPGEEREELELVGRERHWCPVLEYHLLVEVDSKLSDIEDRPFGGARPPERGTQPREELVHGERLRHIVVRPRVQGLDLVVFLSVDGEDACDAHALVYASARRSGGSGSIAAGKASRNEAPSPGFDSAQMRPLFASTKPFAIASPRPAPLRWLTVDAWRKGSKTSSSSSAGSPGPWSAMRTITSPAVSTTSTVTLESAGENLRAFSSRFTRAW